MSFNGSYVERRTISDYRETRAPFFALVLPADIAMIGSQTGEVYLLNYKGETQPLPPIDTSRPQGARYPAGVQRNETGDSCVIAYAGARVTELVIISYNNAATLQFSPTSGIDHCYFHKPIIGLRRHGFFAIQCRSHSDVSHRQIVRNSWQPRLHFLMHNWQGSSRFLRQFSRPRH